MKMTSYLIKREQNGSYRAYRYDSGHNGIAQIIPGYTGTFIEADDLNQLKVKLRDAGFLPGRSEKILNHFQSRDSDILEVWY